MKIEGVTRAEFTELLSGLKTSKQAKVWPASDTSGTIEGRGALLRYTLAIDGIVIEVLHGPWGVHNAIVEGAVRRDIDTALASIRGPHPAE